MEEYVDTDDLVKMEIDSDDEITGWALHETFYDDTLLTLKPIIYTTKLDDMKTVKQNWRELSAEEITNKLQSENKPKFAMESFQNSPNSGNFESFKELSSLVQHINFKARLQKHSTTVRNLKLLKQCKPCNIVLKDIKKISPINKTVTLSHDVRNESRGETAVNVYPDRISQISVKVERLDSVINEEIGPKENKTEMISPSNSEITEMGRKGDVIEMLSDSESSEPLLSTNAVVNVSSKNKSRQTSKPIEKQNKKTEVKFSAKRNKTTESQRYNMKSVSSGKNNKTLKKPFRTGSSDEDDTALIYFKKKPAPVTSVISHVFSLEKFVLVVLIHQEIEAFVYRVNPVKLVTDYYITTDYDEYKLAALYPKEEKVIENYCCWFKREEVVTKICMRKNYSFAIQKFLRLPHSCHPGDCRCCCRPNTSKQSKQQSKVVSKSLTVADSWIRGLLNRNQPASTGLVSKALSYIPKKQVKEKPVEKEPEKYLKSTLLRLKLSGYNKNNVDYVSELYEIGKNANVVRSFLLNDFEKEKHIQRTCELMGILTMEAEICCWYKRERIIDDLQTANMSPAALKLIQRPHNCERKRCKCCCKPQILSLKAIDTLPTALKHTTAYEKNVRSLSIRFNFKSKFPISKVPDSYPKFIKILNLDASVAATILSACASKDDNQELSISILSKFKNLKLGVTTESKLEVLLNGPARNLSIAELKVLSNILDLCAKQMTELGLSPEEFCNRINSKPTQFNPADVTPETLLISAPKITPLSPPNQNDHTLHQHKVTTETLRENKAIPTLLIINKPTNTNNELILKSGTALHPQPQNKPIIESTRKLTSKANNTKLFSNMYSSISNLMETKNKNYVESFKLFFKNSVPATFVVPAMVQFPPVYGLAKFTTEQGTLPKIAETFTLAIPSTEASYAVAGPSGVTRGPEMESVAAESSHDAVIKRSKNMNPDLSMPIPQTESTSNNQTPTLGTAPIKVYGNVSKRTVADVDKSPEDKRIRVKSPSELMATTTQVPVTAIPNNLQTNQIPVWPKPIFVKRELNTNIQSIVNSSQSEGIKINPNLQTQAYRLVSNNVGTVSNAVYGLVNTTTELNNVYHLNGNGVTKVATTSNTNNAGVRYLTLTPIAAPNSNNINKTMLAKILKTPQVQPTALRPCLPSLAPLTTVPVAVDEVSDQAQLDFDVENSICYSLIKIANPEK